MYSVAIHFRLPEQAKQTEESRYRFSTYLGTFSRDQQRRRWNMSSSIASLVRRLPAGYNHPWRDSSIALKSSSFRPFDGQFILPTISAHYLAPSTAFPLPLSHSSKSVRALLMSKNPPRSSIDLYGASPPPTPTSLIFRASALRSRCPAQTFHWMGLRSGLLITTPTQSRTIEKTSSRVMSSGIVIFGLRASRITPDIDRSAAAAVVIGDRGSKENSYALYTLFRVMSVLSDYVEKCRHTHVRERLGQ